MKNFVHAGDFLTLTAPRTVTSGEGVLVDKIFGVATAGYTSGDTEMEVAVKGVFDIAKDTSTFTQGENVYWDNTAFKATDTAASNALIGQAEVAAATGATTVRVRLTGQPMVVDASGAGITADAAEINVLDGVTAGTVTASKGVVVNAVKAVDTLRATTELSVGGTGVAGAALVESFLTKTVIDFTDTVAKDILTVTVPNAKHHAFIDIEIMAILGAGGAINPGESMIAAKYQVVLARTAGVNVVPAISSAIGGQKCVVAGGNAMTSVVLTLSAVSGAVGAANTFTVQAAITKAAGAADLHVAVIAARIINANAAGVTIA